MACAGYEKLKMYGFYVHGGIDGGSRFVVYAVLALNKKGTTLRDAFDEATTAYGFPLRLRADMAFEATFVGQRMIDARGQGAYLTGPSTANQVRRLLQSSVLLQGLGLTCSLLLEP